MHNLGGGSAQMDWYQTVISIVNSLSLQVQLKKKQKQKNPHLEHGNSHLWIEQLLEFWFVKWLEIQKHNHLWYRNSDNAKSLHLNDFTILIMKNFISKTNNTLSNNSAFIFKRISNIAYNVLYKTQSINLYSWFQ